MRSLTNRFLRWYYLHEALRCRQFQRHYIDKSIIEGEEARYYADKAEALRPARPVLREVVR